MKKFKESLLATDLAPWRKKGIFFVSVLLSAFPFIIAFHASLPQWQSGLWELRHFVGIAALQGVAQIAIAWYLLKHAVPNYLIGSFILMLLSFQTTFGITVVLLATAIQQTLP